jgi:YfiH family protein
MTTTGGLRPPKTPHVWVERDGLLCSALLGALGLIAGFTTKKQGSMAGSHHPLEEQARNRATLARTLGFDGVRRTKQVHGREVVRADTQVEPWPIADGQWTNTPGVLLGVAAADCVPILIADPDGPIGVAHAGWQGTTLRVAEALVDAMVAGGADRARLVAALGPSIGPCCYTIDEERAALVRQRIGDDALRRAGDAEEPTARGGIPGAFVLDLWAANAAQLRAAGVRQIEIAGLCTLSGGAELWSYRGRGADGTYGTQLGFIGRPP